MGIYLPVSDEPISRDKSLAFDPVNMMLYPLR